MKQICIGILAHVDAGKTTLSEALLYRAGAIRRLGRVDHQDAFLDTDAMERERGITIFSKQAVLALGDTRITLLDTPGHVDFSAEMERTLQVLDCAVLVISGTDGVQGHTRTLWRAAGALSGADVPLYQQDGPGGGRPGSAAGAPEGQLSHGCVDFGHPETCMEEAAVCDETALERYLDTGTLPDETISAMVAERKLFPCYFGSALKVEGVEELLSGVERYAPQPVYPAEFGAQVFKITRDTQGARLTHMKITGGTLRAKDLLTGRDGDAVWQEKADQLRLYSGAKFRPVDEAEAGSVVAVTGLSQTFPGQGLGTEADWAGAGSAAGADLPGGADGRHDPHTALQKLRQLEEEDPQLHIVWNETAGDPRPAHGRGAAGDFAAADPGAVRHGGRLRHRGSLLPGDHCQRRWRASATLSPCATTRRSICCWSPASRAAAFPCLRLPHGPAGPQLAAADLYPSAGKGPSGGADRLPHHRYENHPADRPGP